jgi:hypothetical protein
MEAEYSEKKTAQDGPYYACSQIPDEAETATAHDRSCQPTGDDFDRRKPQ